MSLTLRRIVFLDGERRPAVLFPVVMITKANINRLYADKFIKKSDVCVGEFKQFCK